MQKIRSAKPINQWTTSKPAKMEKKLRKAKAKEEAKLADITKTKWHQAIYQMSSRLKKATMMRMLTIMSKLTGTKATVSKI